MLAFWQILIMRELSLVSRVFENVLRRSTDQNNATNQLFSKERYHSLEILVTAASNWLKHSLNYTDWYEIWYSLLRSKFIPLLQLHLLSSMFSLHLGILGTDQLFPVPLVQRPQPPLETRHEQPADQSKTGKWSQEKWLLECSSSGYRLSRWGLAIRAKIDLLQARVKGGAATTLQKPVMKISLLTKYCK